VVIRSPKPNANAAIAAAVVILVSMAVALIFAMHDSSEQARRALDTGRVTAGYLDARIALGEEENLEREYLLDPAPAVDARHAAAARRTSAALRALPGEGALVRRHAAYLAAVRDVFAAARAHRLGTMVSLDERVADPQFTALERSLSLAARGASTHAFIVGGRAYATQQQIIRGGSLVVAAACVVFALLGLTIRAGRRRLEAARRAELTRLAEMATTDPLTGLRNHRAFNEDMARELQRAGRQDLPLTLVMLDVDDFKALNSDLGHQAGDERLQALAEALLRTARGTDVAYRIGGDEFAVILPECRAWGGLEFAQRLQRELPGFTATAGVAEAFGLRSREDLLREADQALVGARRLHLQAAIFTPELHAAATVPADAGEDHKRMLATALARAVDAKDAYTRSHCQTVSQLTAVIGAELGLGEQRLARLRLAGLLHDVGKIGVPDAILNKPAKLTDDEYAVMQRHSLLGFDIVDAAGLPEEARWVRHHHERVDGRGYPDRLEGGDIPLESRIILVADAFEAMTSDRPYRRAPGREFALEQLRGGAGAQFDADVVEALCRVLDRTAEPEPAAI
jgi:diguanylate cyclase (GGDEF)-like protein